MSSYTNVTPRIIDPVFDRPNRAEFRLPSGDHVYLSSMRLINVGVTSSTANSKYNPILGALAAIKSISLMDGAEQLDTVQVAPLISAVKNLNRRNDENLSMNRFLKKIGLGYVTSGQYARTTGGVAGEEQFEKNSILVREQNPQASTVQQAAPEKAWISLKDILSFLGASLVVPTSVFKQLRLVVEYNNSSELQYFVNPTNAADRAVVNEGLLLVDEVNDGDMKDMLMKNYKGVFFSPLETDTVRFLGTGAGADTAAGNTPSREQNFLMNGFNGKTLKRLMVVNRPANAATWANGAALTGYGPLASVASHGSGIQIRVNGADLLPSAGVESSSTGSCGNRRLAHAVDTWGDFNVFQGQNFTATPSQADYLDAEQLLAVGQADIFGVPVEQHIRELQVRYSRTAVFGNVPQTQPINLTLIGQVEKAVTLTQGGGYIVAYV